MRRSFEKHLAASSPFSKKRRGSDGIHKQVASYPLEYVLADNMIRIILSEYLRLIPIATNRVVPLETSLLFRSYCFRANLISIPVLSVKESRFSHKCLVHLDAVSRHDTVFLGP